MDVNTTTVSKDLRVRSLKDCNGEYVEIRDNSGGFVLVAADEILPLIEALMPLVPPVRPREAQT